MRTLRFAAGFFRSCLAVLLALLLAAQPAFAGVANTGIADSDKTLPNAPVPLAADPDPDGLTITILDGEGALNNIRARTAREPIVQVTDKNHKPVAGAFVLFKVVPGPNGAGGTFNGASSLNVQTDAQGKAVGHGLKPNSTQGQYQIQVSANFAGVTAQVTIHQTNKKVIPNQPPHQRILKWSIIGVAIAIGIIIGIQSHNYPGTTHITVGGGGVGPP
jgi:hypothetical protein